MPTLKDETPRDQIITYLTLRVLIGAIGVLLPLLVFIGKLIAEGSAVLEFSISDYYDNGLAGDILVGVLFVLGFFLMSYKGPEPVDNRAANIGGIASLGVALFPTTYCNSCWVHNLHFVFALALFSSFIFFSLVLFRKTNHPDNMTQKKIYRNRIYLCCGIIMIICIIAIAVSLLLLGNKVAGQYKLVYWFESIALISFGISWITKSESFYLQD